MKKIAIIIGHNERRQGAQAITPIDASEFEFNKEVARLMHDKAAQFNVETRLFFREFQGSYSKEIKKVYAEVNAWDPDYSTELHFNSAVFTVEGSEMLSSGSAGSLKFARATQKEMVALFQRSGRSDRGVKVRKPGSRGYLSLVSGKAPAIITEPFFGSNRADCNAMQAIGLSNLAEAYLRAMQAM